MANLTFDATFAKSCVGTITPRRTIAFGYRLRRVEVQELEVEKDGLIRIGLHLLNNGFGKCFGAFTQRVSHWLIDPVLVVFQSIPAICFGYIDH